MFHVKPYQCTEHRGPQEVAEHLPTERVTVPHTRGALGGRRHHNHRYHFLSYCPQPHRHFLLQPVALENIPECVSRTRGHVKVRVGNCHHHQEAVITSDQRCQFCACSTRLITSPSQSLELGLRAPVVTTLGAQSC